MGKGGEKFVLAPVRFHQSVRIGLELIALSGDLVTLLVEFEEHTGLAAQDIRLDGLVEEIHRPGLVAPKSALAIRRSGGDKNDWDAARSLGSPHEFGEVIAIHFGHLNIENGERDVVLQQQLQRLRSRASFQQYEPVA